MNTRYYVYKLKVVSPVIAPKLPESLTKEVKSYLKSINKYTNEELEHLDRVFLRFRDPVTNLVKVFIRGTTIRGAIKVAIGVLGRPLFGLRIIGAYFSENSVKVYTQSLIKNGKQKLFTYEFIIPGSEGVVYSLDDLESEFAYKVGDEDGKSSTIRKIRITLPIMISIGAMKSKGHGVCILSK